MSIVNFAIPQILEKRIEQTIKSKGFSSRAELFRFAVMRYLDAEDNLPLSKNKNIAVLSSHLGQVVKQKLGSVKLKLPSLEKQMQRMKKM